MNLTDYPLALTRMGYRRPDAAMNPNRWAKPIGYNVLIADVDKLSISSYFRSPNPARKGLSCWNSEKVDLKTDDYSLEAQISTFEQYHAIGGGNDLATFDFLTKEETIAAFL